MQLLGISIHRYRRLDIVGLSGELDLAGAPDLRNHLRTAAKANNDLLIVDLAELAFTDSTGLSILVEFHMKTKTAGGGMVLVAPRHAVARVLAITGLNRELRIVDELDEAVAALQPGGREQAQEAEV